MSRKFYTAILALWAILVIVGVGAITRVDLSAQTASGISGQIVIALNRFLGQAHTWTGVQTYANGTYAAPIIHGSLATRGMFFDTSPAFVPGISFYESLGGNQYGYVNNSTTTTSATGIGLQLVGVTTTLNDNGTVTLRPQANSNAAWTTNPAMLLGNYDGGFDIDTTTHWLGVCYSVGNAMCEFGRGQEGGTGPTGLMLDMLGNGAWTHNVIRTAAASIGVTTTVGESLKNLFTSTAAVPTQWSPAFEWCGSAWKSNATAASQVNCFKMEVQTLTGAAATTEKLVISKQVAGGAYAVAFTIDGAGSISTPAFVFANIATVMTANGQIAYCSDCTIANPCAGGGNGAIAKRLNGVNVCN